MTAIHATKAEQIAELEAVLADYDKRYDEIAFALGCRDSNCEHDTCIEVNLSAMEKIVRQTSPISARYIPRPDPQPFVRHSDHQWTKPFIDIAWCEECLVEVVPPTEAELDEVFLKTFGMTRDEWRAKYNLVDT